LDNTSYDVLQGRLYLYRNQEKIMKRTILPTILGLLLVGAAPAAAQYADLGDFKLLKPEDKEDVKSTPPPSGAIILFDGKNLEAWTKQDGKSPAHWKLIDGMAMQVEKGGNIVTKEKFGDSFKLHVEFRVPYEPTNRGQGRGNSGVYLQGRYEVQVLDSYGLESKNNDCGAIYEVAAPLKNVCKAPTVWQSYDIEFHAPKFDNGKKTEPARVEATRRAILALIAVSSSRETHKE
jgi:Domain of Unknown Function (DUF1080)